nr:hypothetical transcript [Hymenolepis microstoma]
MGGGAGEEREYEECKEGEGGSRATLRQCDRLGKRPCQLSVSANSPKPHHADGRTTHFLNTVGYPGAAFTFSSWEWQRNGTTGVIKVGKYLQR